MKVVVLQGVLPHYRIPLFEALGQRDEIDALEVVHSGSFVSNQHHRFTETVVTARPFGPLYWQDFPDSLDAADAIIAMFDVHWVRSLFLPWRSPTIFWGSYGHNRLLYPVRTYLARKCGAMILYGDRAKNNLLARGVPTQKLFVAHNTLSVPNAGVDTSQARTALIFVGRLQERKRVDELLRAFAQLPTSVQKGLTVEIVGDGSQRASLEELSQELGIDDQVHFHGTVLQMEELRAIFGRALVYISPGPVGLGLLHSFAYGVPVILNEETWHGPERENLEPSQNGFYYCGGAQGLAETILSMAEKPEQWSALSQNAYDTYQNRNIENMVDGFVQALQFVSA